MKSFEEAVISRLQLVEREVERMRVKESPDMSSYLGITAKAADSDKLDGLDSTDFVLASGLGEWQNWTPTLNTGGADLSGYNSARYCQIGKLVFFTFQASVRNVTGNGLIEIGLPVTCATYGTNASAVAYPINGTYEKVQCKLVGNVMTVAKGMFANPWAGTETGVYVIIEGFYEAA